MLERDGMDVIDIPEWLGWDWRETKQTRTCYVDFYRIFEDGKEDGKYKISIQQRDFTNV